MDLKYPNSHCSLNPSGSHHFVRVSDLYGIWQCKYCLVAKWLPFYDEAMSFGFSVRRWGVNKAYEVFLSRRPYIVKELRKIDGRAVKKSGPKVICSVTMELPKEIPGS